MLNFHEFLHTVYKYVPNSVVEISMMFAKYFEYYTIVFRGAFFREHAVNVFKRSGRSIDLFRVLASDSRQIVLQLILLNELVVHERIRQVGGFPSLGRCLSEFSTVF